jgi:hypothetical protein
MLANAGNEALGVTLSNHHGSEDGGIGQHLAGLVEGDTLSLAQLMENLPVRIALGEVGGVDDLETVHRDMQPGGRLMDLFLGTEQDRPRDPFFVQDLGGLDDLFVVALREDDAAWIGLGALNDRLENLL